MRLRGRPSWWDIIQVAPLPEGAAPCYFIKRKYLICA